MNLLDTEQFRGLFGLLPDTLKASLYYRAFRANQHLYGGLFDRAPLRFAPDYTMHDLVVGDVISGQSALTGFYELQLSRELTSLGRRGGLFVDVGANLGYFTLLWLGSHPENRAIALEASPRNHARIERNFRENSVSDRVALHGFAAGRERAVATFDMGPQEQTGWGGLRNNSVGEHSVEVEVVPLDELVDEHVDVLKVDVEGADPWVLEGCRGLLKRRMIGRIYFEQNLRRMAALGIEQGAAQRFLSDHGYGCRPLDQQQSEWVATPE